MRKALVVASLLLAGAAQAADPVKSTQQALAGTGQYGTAGCGLGSMAFGSQPGFVQILAGTTNYLPLPWQMFGITSGTSNCGKSLFALEGTKVFIEGNKEALAKDAARGQGETIAALKHIAGCQADTAQVGAALQKSFGQLFPAADAPTAQVRDNVIELLRTDKTLGCKLG
jgi:hypothetical protein